MAQDVARGVPQPVVEPAGQEGARLPEPRSPVHETATYDTPRPTPRPVARPAAHDSTRHQQGSRAGWIVLALVSAGTAWVCGWVAGVSWAWRAMTPRYLRRSHRRRGASLAASV